MTKLATLVRTAWFALASGSLRHRTADLSFAHPSLLLPILYRVPCGSGRQNERVLQVGTSAVRFTLPGGATPVDNEPIAGGRGDRRALLRRFRNGSLPLAQWAHRAHVAVEKVRAEIRAHRRRRVGRGEDFLR